VVKSTCWRELLSSKHSFNDPIKVNAPMNHVPFSISNLEKSVGECFAVVADKYPHKLAVVDPHQELTYRSLNQKANRLAHAIRNMEYPGEVPVSFLLERTSDAITAILGILKAGKIYVALDPSNPLDYLKMILDDVQPSLIITNTSLINVALKLSDREIPILNIDELAPGLSDENPSDSPSSSSLAAIFYTSGSTGQPKGVVLDHSALLHRSRVHINLHCIAPEDRSTLPFSLSFAWSITPIFSTLLTGGMLFPCDYNEMQLGELVHWLNKNEITILHISSNLFRQILVSLPMDTQQFPYIRLVNSGSDVLYPHDIENWKRVFQSDCVIAYGLASTEMGTITRKFFNAKFMITENNLPVGYPVPFVKIKLINGDGKEVGANQVGEIVVYSRSMIRGYWGKAGLEPPLFIQDEQNPTEAFFCTGDIGRFRSDGALEFLGRKDNLVKIRGFRVVTSDIATVLSSHPLVQQLFVTARSTSLPDHDKQLVAYIVSRQGKQPTERELRSFLSEKLPSQMIPTRFLFMEQLPHNSRGKVDEGALPDPAEQPEEVFIAPHGALEKKLTKIWSEIFNIKKIGTCDNFFELGGQSLLAFRMMTRVEETMGVKLSAQILLSHPTIADLARFIASTESSYSPASMLALRREGVSQAMFLVPGAARTGLSLIKFVPHLIPGHKIFALEYPGLDDNLEPMDHIETLAEYFVRQIKSVQPRGPYYLTGQCLGGVIAFEMAQQLIGAGNEVGLLVLLDSTPPTITIGERKNGYFLKRIFFLVRSGKFGFMWKRVKERVGKFIILRIFGNQRHPADQKTLRKNQLDFQLDAHSQVVFDRLILAKKAYKPRPCSGRALVIFSEVAKGTPRQGFWAKLLKESECFYIPETDHNNIFNTDHSVDQIVRLINQHIPGKL
jgi:amino acid adenylation domain-containing protein